MATTGVRSFGFKFFRDRRIFLSDSGCPIESVFYITLLNWEFLMKWYNFFETFIETEISFCVSRFPLISAKFHSFYVKESGSEILEKSELGVRYFASDSATLLATVNLIDLFVITERMNLFQDEFVKLVTHLQINNYDYLIGGDYNINLIKYQENSNVSNYVVCLASCGCISLINKPTRFSKNSNPSLLDHIYTNICDEKRIINSGITIFDISDHLPIFINFNSPSNPSKFST